MRVDEKCLIKMFANIWHNYHLKKCALSKYNRV